MFYRQANIERAVEIFAIAKTLHRHVGARFTDLPILYSNMLRGIFEQDAPSPFTAVIEYPKIFNPLSIEKQIEPFGNVLTRINQGTRAAEEIVELIQGCESYVETVFENKTSYNLISHATSKLNYSADTFFAVCVTACAVAIAEKSILKVKPEHTAEAIQYYSLLNEDVA